MRTERRSSPFRSALLLALPLLLAGCWELHKEVTVNPDGSAAVHVVREIPLDVVKQMQMGQEADLEESAREQAAKMVQSAQGVDVWSDVSWSVREQVIRVEGTAYVPDLGEFSLNDPSGDDDQGFSALDYRRTDAGSVIEMALAGEDEEQSDPLPSDLTRVQALEMAKKVKSESRQMRTMAAGMFIDMRETVTLHLPSDPTEVEEFTRGEDGAYTASFEGENLLSAMGAMNDMSADSLATLLMEGAAAGESQEEVMSEVMLTELEGVPARVVFSAGGEPQFDYEARVAEAKESYPELQEKLGIGQEEGAAGGPGGPSEEAAMEMEVEAGDAGGGARGQARGGGRDRDAGAAGAEETTVQVEGPPRVARIQVGRPDLSSTLELGTTLFVTLPSVAGTRRLGLATDAPEGLSVTDGTGRDLVATSREARAAWKEANPNHFTSREAASWSLTTVGDDPEVPAVEISLWTAPSPGARALRIQGEVPVLTPPTSTETATVDPSEISDGATLTLGGSQVTLSGHGTMTRGDERSAIYRVEGDAVVVEIRRAGETLWQLGERGSTQISIPEELSGTEPLEFVFGEPEVIRVPVDLEFGIGLGSGGSSR